MQVDPLWGSIWICQKNNSPKEVRPCRGFVASSPKYYNYSRLSSSNQQSERARSAMRRKDSHAESHSWPYSPANLAGRIPYVKSAVVRQVARANCNIPELTNLPDAPLWLTPMNIAHSIPKVPLFISCLRLTLTVPCGLTKSALNRDPAF